MGQLKREKPRLPPLDANKPKRLVALFCSSKLNGLFLPSPFSPPPLLQTVCFQLRNKGFRDGRKGGGDGKSATADEDGIEFRRAFVWAV